MGPIKWPSLSIVVFSNKRKWLKTINHSQFLDGIKGAARSRKILLIPNIDTNIEF